MIKILQISGPQLRETDCSGKVISEFSGYLLSILWVKWSVKEVMGCKKISIYRVLGNERHNIRITLWSTGCFVFLPAKGCTFSLCLVKLCCLVLIEYRNKFKDHIHCSANSLLLT